MFASVEVVLPEKKPVLVIPITSISYASFGDSVFVIEEKETEGTETMLVALSLIHISEPTRPY